MYILKRIFVERGEHVRLSGLREVFFGLRLRGQTQVARFVEYFEIVRAVPTSKTGGAAPGALGNQRELWLVFHDEGSSLHSFLYYTQPNSLLVQPSPFWQRMRMGGARRAWRSSGKRYFKCFAG